MRFDQFDCADGRRIGFDHVPLEARAGLWGFRDITQFKLQDEEQAEFLATMSHEIKTPLSGIAGAAELLINAGLPERERELAEVIADAAQALGGLVRDTLDVTRAEAGRAEGESEDYDPRRLLTSIAGVLRPSLRGRPLELLVDVDPEVPDALHGDAARVRQIVLNLASNAVKYTESGHARIAARAEDERLFITVSDTGRGIAGEDLGRLFEPWTRNHTRAWAGTGLGLSIARRLARAMGGDVTVVSELGTGSAFTLELPLREGERKVKAPREVRPVAVGEQRAGGRGRRRAAPPDRHAARAPRARRRRWSPTGRRPSRPPRRARSTRSCSTCACRSWAASTPRCGSARPTRRSRSSR